LFYQRRSLIDILKDGTQLYCRYGLRLTRPLVYPVLAQFVGIGLWLGLTYGVVDWMTATPMANNLWLLWTGFILANIPGMWLFFDGFWRYLIWVSALNLMIRELAETGRSEELHPYYIRVHHRAVDYTLVWTFLFGLLFIPIGLGMIPISMFSSQPDQLWMGLAAGGIITGVGLIIALVLMMFFALVFQVFAFTPGSAGASLFRSLDLVATGFWKALAIVFTALSLTQLLLPMVITDISDQIHLTPLLSLPIEEGLRYFIREYSATIRSFHDPLLEQVFANLSADPASQAQHVMQGILLMVVSALLLPLGTCWFALLYADLKTRLDALKLAESASEEKQIAVV
jgi:hypothetical protein